MNSDIDEDEDHAIIGWWTPTDHAKALIGHRITVKTRKRGVEKVLEGVCIGVERVAGHMITSTGAWPAIKFAVRELTTGKLVWTSSFADTGGDPVDTPEAQAEASTTEAP